MRTERWANLDAEGRPARYAADRVGRLARVNTYMLHGAQHGRRLAKLETQLANAGGVDKSIDVFTFSENFLK